MLRKPYLGDGVVGNLVGVFADLVDASLHGLCWPAEDMACDWSVLVISRPLIGHNSPISCSLYSLEREGVSWMGAGARVEGSLFIREGEDWEPGPAIGQ